MKYRISIIAVTLGTVLAAAPAFGVEKSTNELDTAELVHMCKLEAVRGHFKHTSGQRSEIEAHRRRMSALCDELSADHKKDPNEFLQICRKEAAWGARHVHRGSNSDRSHVVRLQRLCGKLAQSGQENS